MTWRLSAFALLLGLLPSGASAMHCGRQVVSPGDHQVEVRQACGEPFDRRTRTVFLEGRLAVQPNPQVELSRGRWVPVEVEEWVYNFGPHQLMRQLWFRDGELIEIRTLGYGF